MPAYVFAEMDITDHAGYEEYRKVARVATGMFGGKIIARGDNPEAIEGARFGNHSVILEFPTIESVHQWYNSDEYAAPKAIRQRAGTCRFVLLPGA